MRDDRERYLRQGVVLPETPLERRRRAALDDDLRSIPLRGRPLPLRLRNFRSSADAYLESVGGPRPYMLRLRAIEDEVARHELALAQARASLVAELGSEPQALSRRWREVAREWSFHEVNELIARHNRWYPVESRLPMDPRTGTYVLVNGRDYRVEPLGEAWILARFPAELSATCSG